MDTDRCAPASSEPVGCGSAGTTRFPFCAGWPIGSGVCTRIVGLILAFLGILGCGSVRDISPGIPQSESLTVFNALDVGFTSSAYFVVARVDGKTVHRNFDRDRGLRMAAGAHSLAVRFYTEGFASSPRGAAECEVGFSGAAGHNYYLEGKAEGARWVATVYSEDGSESWPCWFAGAARSGAIEGGELRLTASAAPQSATAIEVTAPAVPAPAAVTAAPAAAGAPPGHPAGAAVAVKQPPAAARATAGAGFASEGAAGGAAPNVSSGGVAGGIVGSRGRGGCPAGRFRIASIAGEDIRLSGNETVRLLGVRVLDPVAFAAYLAPLVDRCVRIELDDAFARVGHHDREGRLFAYVFLVGEKFVNEDVIRQGLARVDTRARFRYLSTLLEAQSGADAGGG